MLSLEDGECLQSSSVPDVDSWVSPDLTRCHVIVNRMEGEAKDVVSVGGVEPLFVGGACVDHAQCCDMVDYVPIFGVEEIVTTIITTVTGR